MAAAQSDAVLKLIREFMTLNERRRKSTLNPDEIEQWYMLKGKIEKTLFSNPPAPNDKRRSARIPNLKIPVAFDNGFERCQASIREISEGGMFVVTQEPLPVGSQTELSVSTPDGDLVVSARVLYTNTSHSIGERAFAGMGMMLAEPLKADIRRGWNNLFDRLLEEAATI